MLDAFALWLFGAISGFSLLISILAINSAVVKANSSRAIFQDGSKGLLVLPFKLDDETMRRLSVVGADATVVLAERVAELTGNKKASR